MNLSPRTVVISDACDRIAVIFSGTCGAPRRDCEPRRECEMDGSRVARAEVPADLPETGKRACERRAKRCPVVIQPPERWQTLERAPMRPSHKRSAARCSAHQLLGCAASGVFERGPVWRRPGAPPQSGVARRDGLRYSSPRAGAGFAAGSEKRPTAPGPCRLRRSGLASSVRPECARQRRLR